MTSVAKFALISVPVGVIMFLLAGWLGGLAWRVPEVGLAVVLIVTAVFGATVYIGLAAAMGLGEVRFLRLLVGGLGKRSRATER